jgi:ABC-type Fe3+-hydroxamate transport system substrate-binding protein
MTITDQMHRQVQIPDLPQRIISLVPSQTELLHDLGVGPRVIGITKFCIHPETWFRSKSRVGGTKKLDLEKIRSLIPDLIIGNKEENDKAQIEELAREFPVWMSDVRDLSGALDMIKSVGATTGTSDAAADLIDRIEVEFRSIEVLDTPMTVAYFIWRGPYMVAGHGTFVNDMLQRCGLDNVFDADDARYPEISAQELSEAGPDVILLSSEPYPFKEKHIGEFQEICPEAFVQLVDGELFSWYGSRLLKAPAYFKELQRRIAEML